MARLSEVVSRVGEGKSRVSERPSRANIGLSEERVLSGNISDKIE